MKITTLLIICLLLQINFKAQDIAQPTQIVLNTADTNFEFNYIVGSSFVPGYPIRTKNMSIKTSTPSKMLNAPILQVYVLQKKEFIGGILEDEKGNKTKITDMLVSVDGKKISYTVKGKLFDRGFLLADGAILYEDKTTIVFYTEKIGVWKITKRK